MLRQGIFLLLAFLASKGNAECDYCQPGNNVACHSENVYSLCVDGMAILDYKTCPENYHCTADNWVCYPKTEGVASCSRAGVDPDDVDTSSTSSTTIITTEPTTISTTTTTTTTSTTTESSEEACQYGGQSFGNPADSTCSTYLLCTQVNGVLTKKQTYCSTGQWFDAIDGYCTSDKPEGCTVTTSSTTSTTTSQSTTTLSPEEACQTGKKRQNFANPDDPTCSTFLYCNYKKNSLGDIVWYTSVADCDENTWFNVTCVDTKPEGCQ